MNIQGLTNEDIIAFRDICLKANLMQIKYLIREMQDHYDQRLRRLDTFVNADEVIL